MDSSQALKISIQVYKTPRNLYVIDVNKVFGQTFLFLDVTGKVFTELKCTQP